MDLRVERLASGGDGVAHTPDGLTVFIPFTAPGDQVRVKFLERRSRFARAEVLELIEPGPDRTDPLCPAFGRCGGCAWQHISYPDQLRAKEQILIDALRRIGCFERLPAIRVIPSPGAYGYRTRTRVQFSGGRFGYRERRSHRILPIERCPVLVPPLEERLIHSFDQEEAHPPKGNQAWQWVANAEGDVLGQEISSTPENFSGERISFDLAGDKFHVSPHTFLQANIGLYTALHQIVLDWVGKGQHLLELYAGAGFFTLALSQCFDELDVVESSKGSIADLEFNLSIARDPLVRIHATRVEEFLKRSDFLRPDVVLLDPPRAGLATPTPRALASMKPERIVYLSCDAATFARDLKRFDEQGYKINRLAMLDLFPQTPHVESLAELTAIG